MDECMDEIMNWCMIECEWMHGVNGWMHVAFRYDSATVIAFQLKHHWLCYLFASRVPVDVFFVSMHSIVLRREAVCIIISKKCVCNRY